MKTVEAARPTAIETFDAQSRVLQGFHASIDRFLVKTGSVEKTTPELRARIGAVVFDERLISILQAYPEGHTGAYTELTVASQDETEVLRQYGLVDGVHITARGESNGKMRLITGQEVQLDEEGFYFDIISPNRAAQAIQSVVDGLSPQKVEA